MIRSNIQNAAYCLLIVIIPIFLLQGCPLPIPTGREVIGGDEVTDEELDIIRPGITTKKEVIERLGNPDVVWEEERISAYNWEIHWGGVIYFFPPYMPLGGHSISDRYVLLIRFDPNDRVERFEVTELLDSDSYGEHLENWLKKTKESKPTEAEEQSDGN